MPAAPSARGLWGPPSGRRFLSTGLCFQGDLSKGTPVKFTASKVERAGLCVCSPGEGVVLCGHRFSRDPRAVVVREGVLSTSG